MKLERQYYEVTEIVVNGSVLKGLCDQIEVNSGRGHLSRVFQPHGGDMNRVEAYRILSDELAWFKELSYAEIVSIVGERLNLIRRGESGSEYMVGVSVRWQSKPEASVQVDGSVGLADWGSPHDRIDESFVIESLS